MDMALPTVADVAAAEARLRAWLGETPVLESDALDRLIGARVLFKAESLQRSGSFKIRGALNRLLALDAAQRAAGVVAFSSGNHAQAVALAARWLGIEATIVMPADAPASKLEGTRTHGATVVLYDRDREDREAIARVIEERTGAVLVPPFDDPLIIAGQGTAALELARTAQTRGVELEELYVPCSGGGLVAGSALAVKSLFPRCAVYAVEPMGFDDTRRSLALGERQRVAPGVRTICDGLMAAMPGAITFEINRRELAGACSVDDGAVRRAMALAARHLKLVLEPSGAAALAAVLSVPPRGVRTVAVVLSGGNVDARVLTEALALAP
jgi:threonine dehydratase